MVSTDLSADTSFSSTRPRYTTDLLCEPFLVGTRLIFVGSYSTTPSSFTENPLRYTDPDGRLSVDGVVELIDKANTGDTQAAQMAAAYTKAIDGIDASESPASPPPDNHVYTVGATLGGTLSPSSGEVAGGVYYSPGTSSFGLYGSLLAGVGGGISGFFSLTFGTYSSLGDLKGPAIVSGVSLGEGIGGGAELSFSPTSGLGGGSASLGFTAGLTPAEGHVVAGPTGIIPIAGVKNDCK